MVNIEDVYGFDIKETVTLLQDIKKMDIDRNNV